MTKKKNPLSNLSDQLAFLNLLSIQGRFEALADQAAQEHWSYVDYLKRLVDGEVARRQDRSRLQRIKNAHFPVIKTLEQFDFTWPTKINRMAVQELFRLKFIQDKGNVILVGTVGLGKSHLAIALAYAACEAGYSVRFTTAIDAINKLSAAQAVGRFASELRKYTRPEVLLIDELGYLPIDQRGADLLFQIISQRYERGALILTTNKVFKQWPSTFNNDATLTSAILDRVLHHAQTIIIEGKSYRMKDRIDP